MTVEDMWEEVCRNTSGTIITTISDEEMWSSFAVEAEELGLHFPSQKPLPNYFKALNTPFPVRIFLYFTHKITYQEEPFGVALSKVVEYTPKDTTPFHSDDLSSILNL